MVKKTVLFFLLFGCAMSAPASWRCVAVDPGGAMWHQYGPTRAAAAAGAMVQCRAQPIHPTCSTRCYSSSSFWRCLATDSTGKKWYWVGTTKSKAIAKAKTACLHNSASGGCKASPDYCKGINE